MQPFMTMPRAGLRLFVSLLSFAATLVHAHSWVESVYRIDPATRNFLGEPGFPRGGSFRRLSAEQPGVVTDATYINRVPSEGKWTGEETMNKDPLSTKTPDNEVLEVAPGDFIALQHLENGHVTTVEDGKPLNGGTLYIYGTSDPTDSDKIFDIHLKWNKDGTGGDKRGRLLATRNYDDSQCFEGNGKPVSQERSAMLGIEATTTLPCQSDVQLPDDLKPGSKYTIYWYWDWPLLNPDAMDMQATADGSFPWSGAFARGDKGVGFDSDVLTTPEGYTSTIDVKVVKKGEYSTKAEIQTTAEDTSADEPKVYTQAIEKQLKDDNFAVAIPDSEAGDGSGADPSPSMPVANPELPEPLPSSAVPDTPAQPEPTSVIPGVPVADPVTVTVTKTVTDLPESEPTSCEPTSTRTVVEMETQVTTIWADAPSGAAAATTMLTLETEVPTTMATSTRTTSAEESSSSGYAPTPSPQLAQRGLPSNWTSPVAPGVARPPTPGRYFVARRANLA